MALKRIEPNTSDKTLVTRLYREYRDIDLKFMSRKGTIFEDGIRRGDIYKKEDVKAIDQSIANILTTDRGEKPFYPKFGSDLRRLLFELNTTIGEEFVRQVVIESLRRDEPRVEVLDVVLYDEGAAQQVPKGITDVFYYSSSGGDARYTLVITVHCRIKNTGEEITTQVNMNRLR